MKTGLAIVLLTIATVYWGLGGTKTPSTGSPSLISMTLAEYRLYLQTNLPLDRLYVRDGRAYFFPPTGSTGNPEPMPLALPQGGRNGSYHSHLETGLYLQELADRYPSLAKLLSIGLSTEGRELWMLQISDRVDEGAAEPNLYIIGCHHAREWISVEVPLLLARHLLENYDRDPRIRAIVDRSRIFILPITNPDGLEFSIDHYRFWRKTRHYLGNYIWGIDLNRNYGFKWGFDNQGSAPYPNSEVYRGPIPFSEPESAAIRDFLLQHPPAATISYHNYSQYILYPWGYTTALPPDEPLMKTVAAEMAGRIFAVRGTRYEYGTGAASLYKTNGDLDDWVYGTFSVPAYTIELPPPSSFYGGFYTPGSDIEPIFQENLPALLYFIDFFSAPMEIH